jgi:hypothetical protein
MQGNSQLHALAALPQGKKDPMRTIGVWVDSRTGLDKAENTRG